MTSLPHRITVTARRFRWLRRPVITQIFDKETTCEQAEGMGAAARMYGGIVTVEHVDHKPTTPPLDPSNHSV